MCTSMRRSSNGLVCGRVAMIGRKAHFAVRVLHACSQGWGQLDDARCDNDVKGQAFYLLACDPLCCLCPLALQHLRTLPARDDDDHAANSHIGRAACHAIHSALAAFAHCELRPFCIWAKALHMSAAHCKDTCHAWLCLTPTRHKDDVIMMSAEEPPCEFLCRREVQDVSIPQLADGRL